MKSCSDTFKSFKTEVVECIEFCNDIFEEGGVAFVQSPEKERQVAIVCAALAWARQNQQTAEETGGRKFRVLFMSRHDETLLKIRQEIQLSGYEDLDLVLTTYESFFEQLLSDTCRDQLKSSTQEQKEFSLENTAVIVEDADMVDQELREAASNSLSLCVIRKLIKIFDKNAQEDQGLLEVIELAESFESKLFRGIALHKGCDTDPSFSLEDLETIFSRMKVKEFDIEGLATKFNDPGILKIIKFLLCVLNRIKDHKAANNSKSFRMYLTDVWSNGGHEEDCQCGSGCKTIHFICLDASVVLEKMMKQKPHAVIFSSSSLSDYKYLKRELGVNESKEFVGKSSVEDHQIFTRIVTCGVGGYFMNSSYNEWFDVDYMMSLGKTIVKFAEVTPPGEGIIIYLPSKEFKEACLTTWQSDVLNCIAEHKDIFLDPSVLIKHNSFESHLVTTPEESQKCKGPCSFAVLSAKECQDFSIIPLKCRRVVLVVGIPKNNLKDPKIKLKIQSFKENVDSSGLRNLGLGEEYMKQESYKLLRHVIDNQISSLSDYSVILLLDTNYDVGSLPPWLGPKVIWEKRFAELIQELTDFFHVVENRIQWIQDKCHNPTQISTQFGSVRKWEMEKLSLEYRRLKKSNESQQKLIFSLQKKYSDACTHQLELENKLKGFTSPRKRLHQE